MTNKEQSKKIIKDDEALNFVLCWHMHQPWYQEGIDGDYKLPWVYLHAIKDYEDMASHLEAHPKMHVVVNFAPVLLEQLDDYATQLKNWLDTKAPMKDPMLNMLAGVTAVPKSPHLRYQLLCDCQRANAEKMIDPYPDFKKLLEPVKSMFPGGLCDEHETGCLYYLNSQYFIDVLVWYHIAWLGHSLKQTQISSHLIKKAKMFDQKDRRDLLQLIYDCISSLIPRYRKLAESGQIELSMTPYGHPIIPLLNDMDNMQCAQPEAPLPKCETYPGGLERSRWHIQQGLDCFDHYFGMRPEGIWLSEGAISEDAIGLIEEFDFKWTASGEGVWRNSIRLGDHDAEKVHSKRALFHPHILDGYKPKLFFRDDGLSDLIGFEYSRMNSVDAANDLVHHLVNIADFLGENAHKHVVSIIVDGENAWEYYPHNGYYFLDHLYKTLSDHHLIRTSTFSELAEKTKTHALDQLCAGSWVYGSFSTWIGEPDKNRAWDRLVEAKVAYDSVINEGVLNEQEADLAIRQLAICEGSDWFWWFGEKNSSDSVSDFDELFRLQLKNLYELLKLPIPANLDEPLSVGGGNAENAGTMVRNIG
ncbi:MAG: glycoside hydrolase family 57 protein [Gammaproteobacteria bacterium]|nr:glycoside hydrolase family 57 protein [Gammaproteobacteria bacterium]